VRSTGQLVVLKTAPANPDFDTEVSWLCQTAGTGVVSVTAIDRARTAVLLARATPGTRLVDSALSDTQQTDVIAHLIHSSRTPVPAQHTYPSVVGQCAVLRSLPDRFPAVAAILSLQHIAAAVAIVDRLGPSASTHLLHGDLHHENILLHDGRWIIIDPKGVVGCPAHECTALLRNPGRLLDSGVDVVALTCTRIAACAEILGLAPGDIAAWNYAQMVLSAWWCAEDGGEIPSTEIRRIDEFRRVAAVYGIPEAQ
jgi:streptomycin 6-kinase